MAKRVLKQGMTGPQVRELQEQLNRRGYRLQVDGEFGLLTRDALRDFQQRVGAPTRIGEYDAASRSLLEKG